MIIRKKIPGVRKKVYTFESVEQISTARIKNRAIMMVKWQSQLNKMKNEMLTEHSKLGCMDGYDSIMKVIDFYLPAIKLYEKFAESLKIN